MEKQNPERRPQLLAKQYNVKAVFREWLRHSYQPEHGRTAMVMLVSILDSGEGHTHVHYAWTPTKLYALASN